MLHICGYSDKTKSGRVILTGKLICSSTIFIDVYYFADAVLDAVVRMVPKTDTVFALIRLMKINSTY